MTETGREGWTPEERALWDARADNEEWSHAWSILNPMVEISREQDTSMGQLARRGAAAVDQALQPATLVLGQAHGVLSLPGHGDAS